ncbi:MAG: epoxyqueuosine reductase QueH [Candidatus Omnitrophica bacterium]|nr:epoxyqueuosine reductase QueH [Candidatus Omnitrophota bacterium]
MAKKLLVHICCGPCLIHPLARLRAAGWDVRGFFYNPNIAPAHELQLRRQTLQSYAAQEQLPWTAEDPGEQPFLDAVGGITERPERCRRCWYLRLKKTAEQARQQDIGSFCTTLQVSPYQDLSWVQAAGEQAAAETGVRFVAADFRVGYRQAVTVAKQQGMYRQKYCGCRFSLAERARHE